MSGSNSANIARFVHQYKGIEGFYFLNKDGELGYINPDSLRAMKETFPQANDEDFLRSHPKFKEQINKFLLAIRDIPKAYLSEDSASDIELGYVLPVTEGKTWLSSTLILHKSVVDTLERDDKLLCAQGIKDPFQIDLEADTVKVVRSVQRGFDDLLHHKDAFGFYKYFPVLFKLPHTGTELANSGSDKAPVRVLNLKWHRTASDQTNSPDLAIHDTVFSILRANLVKRGAIARDKRIHNKLQIS